MRQYENGSIEVLKDGNPVPVAKPVLREIASSFQIDLLNGIGFPKNTRQLGDHIIKRLNGLAGGRDPEPGPRQV